MARGTKWYWMSGYSMPLSERMNPVASMWFVAPSPSRRSSQRRPIVIGMIRSLGRYMGVHEGKKS